MPRTGVHELVLQIEQVKFNNQGNYVLDLSIESEGGHSTLPKFLQDIRLQVNETKEPVLGRSYTTKQIRQKFPDRVSVLNNQERKIKFFIPSGKNPY